MSGAGVNRPAETRGTTVQRSRASLVGSLGIVLAHLPAPVVGGLCDAVGELWYRASPGRAARARGNLAHVAGWLAATGRGNARARAAAKDPAALEHLVRAAFRHSVRMYAETLRGAASARDLRRRLLIEVPAPVNAAFATPGPVIFVTAHFGLPTFGRQLRKYSRDARAEIAAGRVRRDGSGRDHGYPGGDEQAPPRLDASAIVPTGEGRRP